MGLMPISNRGLQNLLLSPIDMTSMLSSRPWPIRQERTDISWAVSHTSHNSSAASQFGTGKILYWAAYTWHWHRIGNDVFAYLSSPLSYVNHYIQYMTLRYRLGKAFLFRILNFYVVHHKFKRIKGFWSFLDCIDDLWEPSILVQYNMIIMS